MPYLRSCSWKIIKKPFCCRSILKKKHKTFRINTGNLGEAFKLLDVGQKNFENEIKREELLYAAQKDANNNDINISTLTNMSKQLHESDEKAISRCIDAFLLKGKPKEYEIHMEGASHSALTHQQAQDLQKQEKEERAETRERFFNMSIGEPDKDPDKNDRGEGEASSSKQQEDVEEYAEREAFFPSEESKEATEETTQAAIDPGDPFNEKPLYEADVLKCKEKQEETMAAADEAFHQPISSNEEISSESVEREQSSYHQEEAESPVRGGGPPPAFGSIAGVTAHHGVLRRKGDPTRGIPAKDICNVDYTRIKTGVNIYVLMVGGLFLGTVSAAFLINFYKNIKINKALKIADEFNKRVITYGQKSFLLCNDLNYTDHQCKNFLLGDEKKFYI